MSTEFIQKIVQLAIKLCFSWFPTRRDCLVKDELGKQYFVVKTRKYPGHKGWVYLVRDVQSGITYIYDQVK